MISVDLSSLVNGLIPLCGGGVATVVAFKDNSAAPNSKAQKAKRQLRWLGPLLIAIGLWSVGKTIGPLTPTAESVAAALRGSTPLPAQIDQFTRLDAVDGSHQKVTFVSTITKPGATQAEVVNLVRSRGPGVRKQACANPKYQKVFSEGISIEYAYFFNGKELPSIVISPADCPSQAFSEVFYLSKEGSGGLH